MPDNWDFTQKPQRAGAVGQTPILTYLLLALSVVTTAAYLTGGGSPARCGTTSATSGSPRRRGPRRGA